MAADKPDLRPDVKAFVDGLNAMPRPQMAELTVEQARAGYAALHAMGDAPPRELAVIRDLSCPGPAGEIPLRLYDRRTEREPGPMIVFFHGGGYVIGDLETHHNLCTEIAHQMDLPVVAVDYRRGPEHRFPAAIDDCEAATRWIAASPETLDRPARSLILMGDSAGANATVVISQQLSAAPADVPVGLQVPIFPFISDPLELASVEQFAEGYILTKAAMDYFDQGYRGDRADARAFPALGEFEGLPPAVIVTAEFDPIRDSGRDYAARLAGAGVNHIYLEMKGITHSFTNLRRVIPSAQADLERVFSAMKYMLGTQL